MALLALVGHEVDHRTLDARHHVEPVRHCSGVDEFIHRVCSDGARAAVVDLDVWPPWATAQLEKRVTETGVATPLWLRVDPIPPALEKLPRLAMLPCVAQVLSRQDEGLQRWLDGASDLPYSATIPTLRRLDRKFASTAWSLFTAALVLAEYDASEADMAGAVGVSARELRRRLAKAGLPRFSSTMGILRALHAAWRLSELGWTTKRACAAAGYATVKPFESYLRAHTGLTPRQVREDEGYTFLLQRVAQWCVPAPSLSGSQQ